MSLSFLILAATAGSAGLYGSDAYRSYRACIAEVVQRAAKDNVTPEDLPIALRVECPEQRGALSEEIARRAGRSPTVDGAAADAREAEGWTAELLGQFAQRYSVYYATGLWPR